MSLIDPLFYSLDVIKGRRQPDSDIHEGGSLALDLRPFIIAKSRILQPYLPSISSLSMYANVFIVV
jgi:hypothetical protein